MCYSSLHLYSLYVTIPRRRITCPASPPGSYTSNITSSYNCFVGRFSLVWKNILGSSESLIRVSQCDIHFCTNRFGYNFRITFSSLLYRLTLSFVKVWKFFRNNLLWWSLRMGTFAKTIFIIRISGLRRRYRYGHEVKIWRDGRAARGWKRCNMRQ